MKWFLVQFWQFVTTSNVFGVVFGIVLGAGWRRLGKVEFIHVTDEELFSKNEILRIHRENDNEILVNSFNRKGVAVFILGFRLERGGEFYSARRKKDIDQSSLDIIKLGAWSAMTLAIVCEVEPRKGDLIWVKLYNKRKPIKIKIR